MAAKLIQMSVLKQILRLKSQGHSIKSIIRISGISKNTVKKYLRLAEISNTPVEDLLRWEDTQLESYLTKRGDSTSEGRQKEIEELLPYFHQELKKPGVTRWVLWGEYKQLYPEGYGYSHFCLALQKYLVRDQSTMHFEHEPGDKLYFDFAGKKLSFVDKETGEVQEAEVFVAVLG